MADTLCLVWMWHFSFWHQVIFTARKGSLRRLFFTPVCDSVNRGGVRGQGGGGMHGQEACIAGGCAWPGGVACMAKGHVHGKGGHAWWRGMRGEGGVCGKVGACVAKGGMHGKGGHTWQRGTCGAKGGMNGEWGVHGEGVHGKGGHAWQRGACVAKGGMHGMHPDGWLGSPTLKFAPTEDLGCMKLKKNGRGRGRDCGAHIPLGSTDEHYYAPVNMDHSIECDGLYFI